VLAFGAPSWKDVPKAIDGIRQVLGETATGVVLTIGIVFAAGLATEVSRTLLLPLRDAAGWVLRWRQDATSERHQRTVSTLGYSPLELAYDIFREQWQFFNNYYWRWSLSTAQTPELYDIIKRDWETHYAPFEQMLAAVATGPHELWRVAFFASLTQEQALADFVESTLETMQAAWVGLLLTPFIGMRLGAAAHTVAMLSVFSAAVALLLVPTYVKRKRTFAIYLIHAHAVVFQFGEVAEVADREAG
jgi:hypothetical protein